jgi:hypothetical protein
VDLAGKSRMRSKLWEPTDSSRCQYVYRGSRAKGDRPWRITVTAWKNILVATHLGLGTCWLGVHSTGVPRLKKSPNRRMRLSAITPSGIQDRKSIMDGAVVPGRQYEEGLGGIVFLDTKSFSQNCRCMHCPSVRADRSSASNRVMAGDKGNNRMFSFYISRTPGYAEVLGCGLQDIDMGIAMCHFGCPPGTEPERKMAKWASLRPQGSKGLSEYVVSWSRRSQSVKGAIIFFLTHQQGYSRDKVSDRNLLSRRRTPSFFE